VFTLPLIIAIVVGVLLSEIALRVLTEQWPRTRLREIMALQQAFRQAEGDDARQALLLRTGRATLALSLLGFGLFSGLAALAWLPPWALQWAEPPQLAYLVALSVVAALWWFIRRSRYAASHAK
jgi:hypothetical protein